MFCTIDKNFRKVDKIISYLNFSIFSLIIARDRSKVHNFNAMRVYQLYFLNLDKKNAYFDAYFDYIFLPLFQCFDPMCIGFSENVQILALSYQLVVLGWCTAGIPAVSISNPYGLDVCSFNYYSNNQLYNPFSNLVLLVV